MVAFWARKASDTSALMLAHMRSVEQFNRELQGQLEPRMLMPG
ncbi:hypothetical protein [Marinobacterium rhizophilum]|nr:hypothetical protein [Marinobacterium rhizophilum]